MLKKIAEINQNRSESDTLINALEKIGFTVVLDVETMLDKHYIIAREENNCNLCKNNDDPDCSGICYDCLKGVVDHYEPIYK